MKAHANGQTDACGVARCRRAWVTHYNCNGINIKVCSTHRDRLYDLIEAARDRARSTGEMVDFTALCTRL